jgi:hypothetical protein
VYLEAEIEGREDSALICLGFRQSLLKLSPALRQVPEKSPDKQIKLHVNQLHARPSTFI